MPSLRRFALSLTRHASNADDLVQNCLERALGSVASKRPDGDLRAWLFTILYRQFVDNHRRTRRYARMLEFFTGRDDAHPSTERTVMNFNLFSVIAASAISATVALPASATTVGGDKKSMAYTQKYLQQSANFHAALAPKPQL